MRSLVSPDDQKVTFVELFFDLVFVFSVTQVVGFLYHDLDWAHVGKAILVFWLVWWAWTQFIWSLNAADTTHPLVALGVLVATGVAFFMAVTLPEVFGDRSLWFAATYVIGRGIGLGTHLLVSYEASSERVGVLTFAILSVGGLVAVLLGGILGGATQYWLWGLAILLDLVAAGVAGAVEGWNLHPDHFGERHGLFVIIALGETLIVAAGEVTNAVWTGGLIAVAVLAVAISCALWWTYFPRTKPLLDIALGRKVGAKRAELARDIFSVLHFPMLFGVVAYAVAIEGVVAHPNEPFSLSGRVALGAGLMLFVGGMTLAVWRATGRFLWPRAIIILATTLAIVGLAGVSPLLTLSMGFAGVATIAALEQRPKGVVADLQRRVVRGVATRNE